MAGNIRLIGAVGIKVRPDTDDFKRELREDLKNLQTYDIEVKVDADMTTAQRKMKKEREAQEAEKITLNVGFDYDNIKRNMAKVDSMLKSLKDQANQITFTPDKAGLEQAKRDMAAMAKTANVEFKFSRDEAGYQSILKKINDIRRQKIESTVLFKTDAASLRKAEQDAKKALAKIEARKTIDISYGNNYDGINKAIAEIDGRLEALRNLKLKTKLDKKSLEEARAKLTAKLENAKVTIQYNEDKDGYEAVLKRLKAIQREKLQKPITFKTDEDSLATEIAKFEQLIKDATPPATLKLDIQPETNGLMSAMAKIDAALADLKKVEIEVELDEAALLAKRAEIETLMSQSSFKVKLDATDPASIAKARAEVQKMLDETKPKLNMEVVNTPESLRRALHEIDTHAREAEKNKIKLEVESTGLGLMAARLAVFTRPRTVPIHVHISEKSLLIAEGILKSLSGSNTLTSLGRKLENVATNFDTIMLKSAGLGTALGSVVNTLGFVGTSLFSIGEGISQSVGLLAAAPALFTAFAAGIFVYTAAFNNFSNAFSDDAKKRAQAMAELPENARKAVDSLRGTYKKLADPVQNAFWETMGTSLQDAINHLLPQLGEGLNKMASGAGKFTAGVLDSFTEIAQDKQLAVMFDNIALFFDRTGQAAKPFFDGFNQFGIQGSKYLPIMGDWLLKLANRFDDWATKSAKNGDITRWIDEGVQSLKDMWSVGGSVIDIFQGITTASLNAGGATLHDFAEGLTEVADIVNGEPFQSRLTTVLAGARAGASLLNIGFMDLADSVGRSSAWIATVLTQLGQLGGSFLTNVSITMDSPDLQSGISESLSGLNEMVRNLAPSFANLGSVIGGLGQISSAVFRGMAPLLNTVTGMLDHVVSTLGPNLAATATALIEGLTGRLTALQAPLAVITGLLNGLLGIFTAMPEGLQEVVVAAGIFLALRGALSGFLTSVGDSKPFTTMRDNWRMAESEAGRFGTSAERQFRLTTALWEGAGRQVGTLRGHWSDLSTAVSNASTPVERFGVVGTAAMGGIRTALSGIMGFLGGPLGVALMAVTVIGSLIGEKMAASKAKVDNLVSSLDAVTGAVNNTSMSVIAKDWMQLDDDGVDAFWRGAKNAGDAVKILGINTEMVTKAIATGGPEYDRLISDLELIRDNLASTNTGDAYSAATMSLEELSKATGKSVEQLQQMSQADMTNLINQIKGGREAVQVAEQKVKDLATATGLGVGTAGELGTAIEQFGKKGATAAEQISSIKLQLDILKGGALSQQDAARQFQSAWEGALGTIDRAAESTDANGVKVRNSLDYLVDATGKITDFKGAGGQLYDATKQIADATLVTAESTYQSVLKQTGSIDAATKAAVATLDLTPAQIEEFAGRVGISTEKARSLLGNFFGEKWEMQAMFSGNSELFFTEKKKAEDAGQVFGQQQWEAILKAKDESAGGIDPAREAAKGYSTGSYVAALTALPDEALAKIAQAVGAGDAYKRGDYSGILKAIDNTNPGVLAALGSIKGVTNGDYNAAIKAFLDELTKQQTNRDLAAIANQKRQAIIDVFFGEPKNAPPASIARPPGGMNGAFLQSVTDLASLFSGPLPMQRVNVKQFANGGIENHVAQIAKPSSVYRVWAEPETGGEAYIPLALSKRNRSTQILEQVAAQFGYSLNKAQAFKDGGIVTHDRTGGAVNVSIGNYTTNSSDTPDDVARALMRRIKSSGTYTPLEGF